MFCRKLLYLPSLQSLNLGGCNRIIKKEISLCDFPSLEKIVIQRNTLQNISSLRICNNKNLKEIEVEDSGQFEQENPDNEFESSKYIRHDGSLLYADVFIDSKKSTLSG